MLSLSMGHHDSLSASPQSGPSLEVEMHLLADAAAWGLHLRLRQGQSWWG